jgi:hypothetical protein
MGIAWKGHDISKYGDIGSALCAIETRDEARQFWDAYVDYLRRPDAELCGKAPEEVTSSNIGYLMGYYGPEERQRVYDLFDGFGVAHPIFGRSEPAATLLDGRRRDG